VREGILDGFRRRFPDTPEDRFHLVPNGYDPAVFEGVEPRRDDRFGIVYVGTFYGARHPLPLLRATRRALDRRPELRGRLVLRFIGPSPTVLDAWRREAGLESEVIECLGFRPQREAAAWLRGADLLYLNSVEDYVPGKVYEYLGSGREVLALLDPATEVGRLLAGRETAVVIPPGETEGAADVLLDRIRLWLDRGPAPDTRPATELSREAGTRALAGILDGLVA
jgi:glycosyltransferase involved in cell wall biosynthesis